MKFHTAVLSNFKKSAPKPGQKSEIFACAYCNIQYAKNTTRMCNHLLQNCRACPENIKKGLTKLTKEIRKGRAKSSDESVLNENLGIQEANDGDIQACSGAQKKVTTFLDHMSKEEEQNLQEMFAKRLYVSGSPLSMSENPWWQTFFKCLRPSFNLPSRHKLSGTLLDRTYETVKLQVEEIILSSPYVGIQADGWSNIRNESVINFIVTTPKPVHFKSLATEAHRHTGEYIAQEIGKVIEEIGKEKVLGVVTDNASNMKRAWTILDDKYENTCMAFYGCAAHILNLLIKDLAQKDSMNKVIASSNSLIREIKDSQVLSSLFFAIQKQEKVENQSSITSLILPGKTRWGSNVTSLKSLKVNKTQLQKLAISLTAAQTIKPLTKSLILDYVFWLSVERAIDLMNPLADSILQLESDSSSICQTVKVFNDIKAHLNEQFKLPFSLFSEREKQEVEKALKKRTEMAIKPIHLLADFLDPSSKGKLLSEEQMGDCMEYLQRLGSKFCINSSALLNEYAEYATDSGWWSNKTVKEAASKMSPVVWWKGFCKTKELSKIGVAILQLPPTSAATERTFSTNSWIHSSKRNKLTVQRSNNIAYIANNSRLLDKNLNTTPKSNQRDNDDDDEDDDDCDEDDEETDDGTESDGCNENEAVNL